MTEALALPEYLTSRRFWTLFGFGIFAAFLIVSVVVAVLIALAWFVGDVLHGDSIWVLPGVFGVFFFLVTVWAWARETYDALQKRDKQTDA